jgi:hypothetical protein
VCQALTIPAKVYAQVLIYVTLRTRNLIHCCFSSGLRLLVYTHSETWEAREYFGVANS